MRTQPLRSRNVFRKSRRQQELERRRRRLQIQSLEDRAMMAIFNVTANATDGAAGSLRWAITQANLNGSNDTINLAAGTYTLTLQGAGENNNATGDLDLKNSGTLTIQGASAASTIIDGHYADRVFDMQSGVTASISNVTIRHGTSGSGGGIGFTSSNAVLSLTDCVISDNQGTSGGGLYCPNGSISITNCTFRNNTASSDGGGVRISANSGSYAIVNSVFENNSGARGGGLYLTGTSTATITGSAFRNNDSTQFGGGASISTTSVDISGCEFSGNTCDFGGGGLSLGTSQATITNTTLSGNTATGTGYGGGGLYSSSTTVTLLNCTLANNTAVARGGGIMQWSTSVFYAKNTILAGNTAGTTGPDFSGTLNSQGWNLIQSTSGMTLTGTTTGNKLGQNPLLGALADNGGPTRTHSIPSNSPALDAGTNAGAPAIDQRGQARPKDGDGNGTATVDMGAYERPEPNFAPVASSHSYSTGEDSELIVTAAGLLAGATDPNASDTITVQVPSPPITSTKGATVEFHSDGWFRYDPRNAATLQALKAGESTTDTFTYTITDGQLTNTATVTITVNGANDAPVVKTPAPSDLTVNEDASGSSIAFADVFSDADDAPTYSYTNSNTSLVQVTRSGDALYWTYAANQHGAATINLTANDGTTSTSTSFLITVNGVNDAPYVANPVSDRTAAEDGADQSFSVANVFSDVDIATDGDSVTTTLYGVTSTQIVEATLDPNTLLLTLHFPADHNGEAWVTLRGTDTHGAYTDHSFRVTVSASEDQPINKATMPDIHASEDDSLSSISLWSYFDDVDLNWGGDTLTFTVTNDNASLVSFPNSGGVPSPTGLLALSLLSGAHGVAHLTVRATDAAGYYVQQGFILTVDPGPPEPLISGSSTTLEGSVYTLDLDADAAIGEWLINWGDGSAVSHVAATATSVPHIYADGYAQRTISATFDDGAGTYSPLIKSVTVENVAPHLSISGASTTAEGSSYTITFSSDEPGADTVSNWQINWGDGTIDYKTGALGQASHAYADGASSYRIQVTATDEDGTYHYGSEGSAGQLDPAFGTSGIAALGLSSFIPTAITTTLDGKLLLVGSFGYGNDIQVVRLTASGALDTTFGSGGSATFDLSGSSDQAGAVTVLSTGQIVVAAAANGHPALLRLMADGTRDTSFGSNGVVTSSLAGWTYAKAALASDGSAIFATSNVDFKLTRLMDTGSVDSSFGTSGIATVDLQGRSEYLYDLTVLPDGKLLVVGLSYGPDGQGNSVYYPAAARLLPTGALDSSFGNLGLLLDTTISQQWLLAGGLQPGQGVVAALASGGGPANLASVVRYLDGGYLDTNFGSGGVGSYGVGSWVQINDLVVQGDGKIVFVGCIGSSSGFLIGRFTASGTADTSYSDDGWDVVNSGYYANLVTLDSEGCILVAGQNYVARISAGWSGYPVTVTNVAPTLTISGPAQQSPGVPYTLNLGASDPGNDTISSWTIHWGDGQTQNVSGNPSSVQHIYSALGTYSITANAADEDGSYSATAGGQSSLFLLIDTNPTAGTPAPLELAEDVSLVIPYASIFADADIASYGDSLTYCLVSNSNTGLVSITGGLHLVANAHGTANLTLRATDARGQSVTTTLQVIVTAQNDPPTAAQGIGAFTRNEDSGTHDFSTAGYFQDVDIATDGDVLHYDLVGTYDDAPFSVDINHNTGLVTITTRQNLYGTRNVTVRATDQGNATADAVIPVVINSVNDAPYTIGEYADLWKFEDSAAWTLSLAEHFGDYDGDPLTYEVLSSNPDLVSFNPADGKLHLAANQHGEATITVRTMDPWMAADPTDLPGELSFSLTVYAIPDAPVVAQPIPNFGVLASSGSTTLDLSQVFGDADLAEGDGLYYEVIDNSRFDLVSAIIIDHTLTLTYDGDANGTSTFTLRATDQVYLTVDTTFSLTITGQNLPPEVVPGSPSSVVLTAGGGPSLLDVSLLFQDPDAIAGGIPLDFELLTDSVTGPADVQLNDNWLSITPQPGQWGPGSFTVAAKDSLNGTTEKTIEYEVEEEHGPPRLTHPLANRSLLEDGSDIHIALGEYFENPSGGALTYKVDLVSLDGDSVLPISAVLTNEHELILHPESNQSGRVRVDLEVANDPAHDTPPLWHSFVVDVQAVDDPQQRTRPSVVFDVAENELDVTAQTLDISQFFVDIDQPWEDAADPAGPAPLRYYVVSDTGGVVSSSVAHVSLSAEGQLRVEPREDSVGTIRLTVQALDADGDAVSLSVTIHVLPAEEMEESIAPTVVRVSDTTRLALLPLFLKAIENGDEPIETPEAFDEDHPIDERLENNTWHHWLFDLEQDFDPEHVTAEIVAPSTQAAELKLTHVDEGSDTIAIRAKDPEGRTWEVSLEVQSVTPVTNHAPVVVSQPADPPPRNVSGGVGVDPHHAATFPDGQDTTHAIDFAQVFHDPDDDALTYSVVSIDDPLHMLALTPQFQGSQLTLAFDPRAYGALHLTVRATDEHGESTDLTFGQSVSDNWRPFLSPYETVTMVPGQSYDVFPSLMHADSNDTLTYSLTSPYPEGMEIDAGTGQVSWSPTADQGGQYYTATVVVTDGTPNSQATTTLPIYVLPAVANLAAPEFYRVGNIDVTGSTAPLHFEMNEGERLYIPFFAHDADSGDTVTYHFASDFWPLLPADSSIGSFEMYANWYDGGSIQYGFTVTVTDSATPPHSATIPFTVHVNDTIPHPIPLSGAASTLGFGTPSIYLSITGGSGFYSDPVLLNPEDLPAGAEWSYNSHTVSFSSFPVSLGATPYELTFHFRDLSYQNTVDVTTHFVALRTANALVFQEVGGWAPLLVAPGSVSDIAIAGAHQASAPSTATAELTQSPVYGSVGDPIGYQTEAFTVFRYTAGTAGGVTETLHYTYPVAFDGLSTQVGPFERKIRIADLHPSIMVDANNDSLIDYGPQAAAWSDPALASNHSVVVSVNEQTDVTLAAFYDGFHDGVVLGLQGYKMRVTIDHPEVAAFPVEMLDGLIDDHTYQWTYGAPTSSGSILGFPLIAKAAGEVTLTATLLSPNGTPIVFNGVSSSTAHVTVVNPFDVDIGPGIALGAGPEENADDLGTHFSEEPDVAVIPISDGIGPAALVPMVIRIPDHVELTDLYLDISYQAADTRDASIVVLPDGNGTSGPRNSALRLWTSNAEARNLLPLLNEGGGGDFVAPGRYLLSRLPFESGSRAVTLYAEAVGSPMTYAVIVRMTAPLQSGYKEWFSDEFGHYPEEHAAQGQDVVVFSAVAVDLDVNSDNTGNTIPWDSTLEDAYEAVVDRAHPGAFVAVNNADSNADGQANYSEFDDQSAGTFLPLTLTVPGYLDRSRVRVSFDYKASDPEAMTDVGVSDYPILEPATGYMRLWRAAGDTNRSKTNVLTGGHYIAPNTSYTLAQLGLTANDFTDTLTLYVEGIRPTVNADDKLITVALTVSTEGASDVTVSDTVAVDVVGVDLDIDSDNSATESTSGLDRNEKEDQIEAAGPQQLGKVTLDQRSGKKIKLSEGDTDHDGVGDAYDFNGDNGQPAAAAFTPVAVELPADIDLTRATITFHYSSADPYHLYSSNGHLRLWTADGTQNRNPWSIATHELAGEEGDFVVAERTYTWSQLVAAAGVEAGSREVTLYLEGVQNSTNWQDLVVSMSVRVNALPALDSAGRWTGPVRDFTAFPSGLELTDSIRVNVGGQTRHDPHPEEFVSIFAADAYAVEGSDSGAIVISRGEAHTTGDLHVFYKILTTEPSAASLKQVGSHSPDIASLGAPIAGTEATFMATIPAGASSVTIPVQPLHDDENEWDESVTFELVPDQQHQGEEDGFMSYTFAGMEGDGPEGNEGENGLPPLLANQARIWIFDSDKVSSSGFVNRNLDAASSGLSADAIAAGPIQVGIQQGQAELAIPLAPGDFQPRYRGDDNLLPLVSVDWTLPQRPTALSARLTFADVAGTSIEYALAQLPQDVSNKSLRVVLLGSDEIASKLGTGHYSYTAQFTATIGEGDDAQTRTRTILGSTEIVNLVDDDLGETQFGKRWWVDDLDRLVPADGTGGQYAAQGLPAQSGVALIRGDNTSVWFASTIAHAHIIDEPTLSPSAAEWTAGEAGENEVEENPADLDPTPEDPWANTSVVDSLGVDGAHHVALASEDVSASWSLQHLTAGHQYQLYTTWTPGPDRVLRAEYTIEGGTAVGSTSSHAAPTEDGRVVTIDQRYAPGDVTYENHQWRSLGFFIATGDTITVTLAAGENPEDQPVPNGIEAGDRYLVADAMLVVDDWSFTTPAGSVSTLDYGVPDTRLRDHYLGELPELNEDDTAPEETPPPADNPFFNRFILSGKYGERSEFDSTGLLRQTVDRNANRVVFQYEEEGDGLRTKLASITVQGGLTTQFVYSGSGQLSTVTDPVGRVTTYEPDTENPGYVHSVAAQATGVATSANQIWTFAYSAAGLLTSLTDGRAAGSTSIDYDPFTSRVSSVTNADGATWDFVSFLGDGLAAESEDGPYPIRLAPTGKIGDQAGSQDPDALREPQARYIDARAHLLAAENQYAWTYQTDRFGLVTALAKPALTPGGREPVWITERDANGLATKSIEPTGGGGAATIADKLTTEFFYDTRFNLLSVQTPDGVNESWTYDPDFSQTTTHTTKRGSKTTFELDDRGNVVVIIDPLNQKTELFDFYAAPTGPAPATPLAPADDTLLKQMPGGIFQRTKDAVGIVSQNIYYGSGALIGLVQFAVTAVGLPEEATTTFQYDAHRYLSSVTDELGRTTTYVYDALGQLVEQHDPNPGTGDHGAPVTKYEYDAVGNTTKVTNPLEVSLLSTYDGMGRLKTQTLPATGDHGPSLISYEYDPSGNLKQVIEPSMEVDGQMVPRITDYDYDPRDEKSQVVLPAPAAGQPRPTHLYAYDELGNLKQEVVYARTSSDNSAATGFTTTFTYDKLHQLDLAKAPAWTGSGGVFEAVTDYDYDADGNLVSVKDPADAITRYAYDAAGRKTQVTDATNGTETVFYDAAGRAVGAKNKLGGVTVNELDGRGRVVRTTDALGRVSQSTYTQVGTQLLVTTTDYRGLQTQQTFDALGRLIETRLPDPDDFTWRGGGNGPLTAPVTTVHYTIAGQIASTVDPLGRTTSHEYDARGRETATTNPAGQSLLRVYDEFDNVVQTIDVGNRTTSIEYDALDRPFRTRTPDPGQNQGGPSGTLTTYNEVGQQLSVGEGQYNTSGQLEVLRTSTFVYDLADRLMTQVPPARDTGDIPANRATESRYNADGTLASTTIHVGEGATATTSYQYDALKRQTVVTDANNGTTTTKYLKGGQVESVTDPASNRTAFQYDQLGRQTKEIVGQAGAGLTRTTLYDPLDRFRVAIDRNGRAIRYTLDNLGRSVKEEWFATSNTSTTPIYVADFSFDAAGQLVLAADSRGGAPVSTYVVSERDDAGRDLSHSEFLTGFGTVTTTQAYNGVNDRTSVTIAAGTVTAIANTYEYDNLHRIVHAAQSSGLAKSVDLRYGFDNKPLSIQRYASLEAGETTLPASEYDYYADGSLASLTHVGELSYGYTFDSAGRIASESSTDIRRSRPPQTITYDYDKLGQIKKTSQEPPEVQATYDANGNRLDNGNRIGPNNQLLGDRLFEYEYDQEGNRVKKTLRQTTFVIDNRSPGFDLKHPDQWEGRARQADPESNGYGPDDLINKSSLASLTNPVLATFTQDNLPAGDYEVGITWRAEYLGGTAFADVAYKPSSDFLATYSAAQPLNFASAPYGQMDNNGTRWQVLKSPIHFNGSGYIQVRVYGAAGTTNHDRVILDAVRLRRVSGTFETPAEKTFEIDAPELKFIGNWSPPVSGSSQWISTPGAEPSTLAVDIPMLDPGEYRVLMNWTNPVAAAGSSLTPQIKIGDGPLLVGVAQLDQTHLPEDLYDNGRTWDVVGTYPIANGMLHLEVTEEHSSNGVSPTTHFAINSLEIQRITDNTPITTYVWDHKNRLVETVRRDANYSEVEKVTFTYDVLAHKVKQVSDFTGGTRQDATEYYLYDGDQQVATLVSPTEVRERRLYGQATDQVLAIEGWGTGSTMGLIWPLLDPQGTTRRVLLTSLGQPTYRDFQYDSFGRPQPSAARPQDDDFLGVDAYFSYTGREYDFDLALQDNRARFYDPFTHQFISQDPIGLASGDTNLYRYAGNSPTNATDPSGHIINAAAGAIGAAIGGVTGAASYAGKWAWNGGFYSDWDNQQLALYAGSGAAAGGLAGLTFGASLGVMTGATVVTASTATSSVVIAGAASGLVGGYTGAFLNTTGQNRLAGKSWSESLAAGHQAGAIGGATGAIGGALGSLISAGMGGLLGQVTNEIACDLPWTETAKLLAMHMAADAAGDVLTDSSVQAISIAAGLQEDWDWGSTLTSGITGLGQGAFQFAMSRACFTGETKLVVPAGLKRIDLFKKDDLVGSRNEHDPTGPLEWKRVLQVFKRTAPIVELTLRGHIIRTTLEHPFHPIGGVWTATHGLEVGQLLVVLEGEAVMVDSIRVTDELETVYNLDIEDHHTYFVSGDEWDFAVWAHNQSCEFRRVSSQGENVFENDGNSRRLFEKLRNANLDKPNNFPGIDRVNRSTGLGTSMKTIDLTTKRASDPTSFRKLVRGYIDDLRAFSGPAERWSTELGDYVRAPKLRARRLEIGVQDGLLTPDQTTILREEARRAARVSNPVAVAVFGIF